MRYLQITRLILLRNGARAALLLMLTMAAEQQASAYTDPGSGALLWQVLVAGFVGGMYYFRSIFARLRGRKRE